jgi:hypothetical protein
MLTYQKKQLKKIVSLPSQIREADAPSSGKTASVDQYQHTIQAQQATITKLTEQRAKLITAFKGQKSQAAQAQTQSESDKAQLDSLTAELANTAETLRLAEEATADLEAELAQEKTQQQQLVRAQDDSVREAAQAAELQRTQDLESIAQQLIPHFATFSATLSVFLTEHLAQLPQSEKIKLLATITEKLDLFKQNFYAALLDKDIIGNSVSTPGFTMTLANGQEVKAVIGLYTQPTTAPDAPISPLFPESPKQQPMIIISPQIRRSDSPSDSEPLSAKGESSDTEKYAEIPPRTVTPEPAADSDTKIPVTPTNTASKALIPAQLTQAVSTYLPATPATQIRTLTLQYIYPDPEKGPFTITLHNSGKIKLFIGCELHITEEKPAPKTGFQKFLAHFRKSPTSTPQIHRIGISEQDLKLLTAE